MDDRRVGRHVSARTGLAVTGDRAIDKSPIELAEAGVVKAEPPHDPGTVILDENVGIARKATSGRYCGRGLKVKHDTLFAGIELTKIAAAATAQGWPRAHHVALRRLDLDHFGAEVSEQPRAVRTGDGRREIKNAQARIGSHR